MVSGFFCSRLEETSTPQDHSELFKEVDEDNIERVKKFLVDNPNGWREVKDKVSIARCTIHILSLYSMGQPYCTVLLVVKTARDVWNT